jgi:hypothetical protein
VKYTKTEPCDNCPFRSDKPFHLRPGRVKEIMRSLVRGDFPCHKTTVHRESKEGGDRVVTDKSLHCAGALILLEKLEQPSQMMRICERMGMYDRTKLKMNAPVYDNWREMEKGCQ